MRRGKLCWWRGGTVVFGSTSSRFLKHMTCTLPGRFLKNSRKERLYEGFPSAIVTLYSICYYSPSRCCSSEPLAFPRCPYLINFKSWSVATFFTSNTNAMLAAHMQMLKVLLMHLAGRMAWWHGSDTLRFPGCTAITCSVMLLTFNRLFTSPLYKKEIQESLFLLLSLSLKHILVGGLEKRKDIR